MKILRQIVDAMCFNYVELGISHGYINPANILKIDDYYNIKITDFITSILIENSIRLSIT